ncbi:acetylornithine transaminase [Enterococcus sp. LJL99]
MSYLFSNYSRKPFEIISGKGAYLTDQAGKKYLDFTSGIGVMNLGYANKELNEVLTNQASLLWHTPNLYENHLQEEVAKALANGKDYVSYFCNSGAEANEAALKLARKATNKSVIVTFNDSFHGRTYGAMSATAQSSIHLGFEPLVPDFLYLPFNDSEALKQIGDDTAAIMLELIQGEGGIVLAEKSWIKEIVALCKAKNILLIADEIQTGIGRTGTLFLYEQYEIEPDIITLAKGLGNGIPVGAMVGKKELASVFGPGSHGSTFGGNKLAMSVADKVLDLVNTPELLNAVQQKSQLLKIGLAPLNELSNIKEVRGTGLMIGIELINADSLNVIIDRLAEKGLLVLRAGKNVLRLLPPLIITEEEIEYGIEMILEVLKEDNEND